MADDPLIVARKRAERAVEGMAEGPLKIAAFQTILAKLLTESDPVERAQPVPVKAPAVRSVQAGILTGRHLAVMVAGSFKKPSVLWQVGGSVGSRGWRYPPGIVSGVMQ